MTLYQFNALPYERQLVVVFDEGTFLARRWEEEDGVNLYHVAGPQGCFFVEVCYDTHANAIAQVRSFRSAELLADYAPYVRLPDNL